MTSTPKTILVTGAASGIGFACVRALLKQGDKVCAADLAPVPVAQLGAYPPEHLLTMQTDVANTASCRAAVDAAAAKFGRITG